MNLAFKPKSVLENEYATKSELHYALHVSYARIAMAIRDGKLSVHLVDGKVQLRVAEVISLFVAPQTNLFE
jgi:hypothetical protein